MAHNKDKMPKNYPKNHLIIVSTIAIIMGLVLLVAPSEEVSAKRDSIALALDLPEQSTPNQPIIEATTQQALTANQSLKSATQTIEQPKVDIEDWKKITVKSGDNLTTLFKRAGLTARDVYEVSQAATKQNKKNSLRKIFPGEQLAFVINEGKLKKFQRIKSPLESIEFVRQETGYSIEKLTRSPEIHNRFVSATLENSLFMAGQKAGLPQKLIMELANVFGGVIDFIYDPRKGDSFNLLFEEKFLDGKKIGTGKILAAQFINRGQNHTAIYYEDSNGDSGHYSPKGVSMRKAFLRAPLDFTRISSGFNPRRKHPIHKKIRAHRGIDYAAPRGTPIFAAGDGRVVASGFSKANGKFVFIKHGEQYTTKYLHLHRRAVKKGQRVKQGQIIGQVGSTGYATGPHLHYEFLVNGVHRNPRTILDKLPKAKSIANKEKPRFVEQTTPLIAQLEAHQQMLAYNE